MAGVVTTVSRSEGHTLTKLNADSIRLLAGLGVEGDAHSGATVKHRSRLARFANEPNLRQIAPDPRRAARHAAGTGFCRFGRTDG